MRLYITWVEIGEESNETILARIVPDASGSATIQMNQRHLNDHFDEYAGTEAYSLAHEAGHWVLHFDRGQTQQLALASHIESKEGLSNVTAGTPLLCRRMNAGDRREFQAERFASYLLLPMNLVLPLVVGRDCSQWSTVASLAQQCGVSKRAMTYRLEDLGVIPAKEKGNRAADLTREVRGRRLF